MNAKRIGVIGAMLGLSIVSSETRAGETILSANESAVIGDHVRQCWTKDVGAVDVGTQRAIIKVTTDAGGIARKVEVGDGDVGRLSEPRFRAFAERAMRAIMDPRCATLPLPPAMLGKVSTLTFLFSP